MPAKVFETVDRYLTTELSARALSLALAKGWIDWLLAAERVDAQALNSDAAMPQAATQTVLDLLSASSVVEEAGGYRLTRGFHQALEARDLLEAKLWFANLVAPDIHEHFEALLTDVPRFMEHAKVFELFRYDRCLAVSAENLELSLRWVNYTTTLTKYEAPEALAGLDLSASRSLLDVGGNSGEFARQACARHPQLQATVYDLPVVCELGRQHVGKFVEGERVHFVEGDLRSQSPLPRGHDIISFKSVLHDWPEDYAKAFLGKAVEALLPGGRLAIFERGKIRLGGAPLTYAMVPNLVFLPFFREPSLYLDTLAGLGMTDIAVEWMELDMPFFLVTARKPAR